MVNRFFGLPVVAFLLFSVVTGSQGASAPQARKIQQKTAVQPPSTSSFRAGRIINEKSDTHLRIMAGSINEIEGMVEEKYQYSSAYELLKREKFVQEVFGNLVLETPNDTINEETTRKVYELEGRFDKLGSGETYTEDDFNMKGPYPTLGLSFEKQWKYFTVQMDLLGFKTKANTVARRNYYIGIGDDILYEGQEYSNMKIPEGTPFSMDILGGIAELRGLITPLTYKPSPNFQFTPWLDVGLLFFAGQYDLDAGISTGTTNYMNPPEGYVIGGESSGLLGLGLPQVGLGGEIRIGGENSMNFVLQADYSVCIYEGSSSFLTSSSKNEKDVDIDHTNMKIRMMLEFPMNSGRMFTAGLQYQQIESEGSITTTDDTPEEILADREKWDKYAKFKLTSIVAMVGLTF